MTPLKVSHLDEVAWSGEEEAISCHPGTNTDKSKGGGKIEVKKMEWPALLQRDKNQKKARTGMKGNGLGKGGEKAPEGSAHNGKAAAS